MTTGPPSILLNYSKIVAANPQEHLFHHVGSSGKHLFSNLLHHTHSHEDEQSEHLEKKLKLAKKTATHYFTETDAGKKYCFFGLKALRDTTQGIGAAFNHFSHPSQDRSSSHHDSTTVISTKDLSTGNDALYLYAAQMLEYNGVGIVPNLYGTGIRRIDYCGQLCMAYTGSSSDLTECLICETERTKDNYTLYNSPREKIRKFFKDKTMAQILKSSKHTNPKDESIISDVWNAEYIQELKSRSYFESHPETKKSRKFPIELSATLMCNYIEDFSCCTDGYISMVVVINNLPETERLHSRNIIPLYVIPQLPESQIGGTDTFSFWIPLLEDFRDMSLDGFIVEDASNDDEQTLVKVHLNFITGSPIAMAGLFSLEDLSCLVCNGNLGSVIPQILDVLPTLSFPESFPPEFQNSVHHEAIRSILETLIAPNSDNETENADYSSKTYLIVPKLKKLIDLSNRYLPEAVRHMRFRGIDFSNPNQIKTLTYLAFVLEHEVACDPEFNSVKHLELLQLLSDVSTMIRVNNSEWFPKKALPIISDSWGLLLDDYREIIIDEATTGSHFFLHAAANIEAIGPLINFDNSKFESLNNTMARRSMLLDITTTNSQNAEVRLLKNTLSLFEKKVFTVSTGDRHFSEPVSFEFMPLEDPDNAEDEEEECHALHKVYTNMIIEKISNMYNVGSHKLNNKVVKLRFYKYLTFDAHGGGHFTTPSQPVRISSSTRLSHSKGARLASEPTNKKPLGNYYAQVVDLIRAHFPVKDSHNKTVLTTEDFAVVRKYDNLYDCISASERLPLPPEDEYDTQVLSGHYYIENCLEDMKCDDSSMILVHVSQILNPAYRIPINDKVYIIDPFVPFRMKKEIKENTYVYTDWEACKSDFGINRDLVKQFGKQIIHQNSDDELELTGLI